MAGILTNPSTVYTGQTYNSTGAYPGQTGQYTQNAYLNGLNTFSNTPFQTYGGEMTAGVNPIQNTAAYNQMGLAGYQPQQVAPGNITQYAGGNGAGGLSMGGMDLSGYMSPYTSGVINTSMDQLNRQLDRTNVASDGQAAMSGAFGGDRAQIVDTENARNSNQIAAQTIAGLNQSNFANAQGLATGDLNRQLQAGTQQAGLNLQAGQGNQFADLQGANLRNGANNAAFQMGTAFQNTNQTADTNAYGQYLRAFQYPFQQAQGAAGLTSSYAPSLQYQGTQSSSSSSTQTPPAPSTYSQVAGGLTAAAGLGGLLFGSGGGSGGGNSGAGGLLGLAGKAGNYIFGTGDTGTGGAAAPGLLSNIGTGISDAATAVGNGVSDAASWVSNLFEDGGRVGGLLAYADGGRIGYDDGGVVPPDNDGTYVAIDNSQTPNIDAAAVAAGIVPGAVQTLPDGPAVPIAAAVDQKGLAAAAEMAKPRRERSANPSAPIPTHDDSAHGSVQPPDISTAPAVSVPGDNDLISRAPLKAMGPQGLMGAAMAAPPGQAPIAPVPGGPAPGSGGPDVIDSMYARGGNSWAMPVLAAGLGMMASKSSYFAQGIGEGGLAGMQEAQNVAQMRMSQAQASQKLALGQQQLRGAAMGNDANAYRLRMMGVPSSAMLGGDPSSGGGLAGAAGVGGGGGAGGTGAIGGAMSGAPQMIAPNNNGYLTSPQYLTTLGQMAEVGKPGSGAAYFKLAQQMAQKGYTFDNQGNVALAPGFLQSQAAMVANGEWAKLPAQVQKAAAEAQIRTHEALVTTAGQEQIRAPYAPPIKTDAIGADGLLHEQQTPLPQWAAQNGAGGAQDGTGPAGFTPGAPGAPVVRDPVFQKAVGAAASALGVDPNWAMGIHAAETGNAQNSMGEVSPAGARGGMQMMPGTAGGMGLNPDNGPQNAAGGVAYLAQLQNKYNGNKVLATAAYNAGPGRADQFINSGRPLPAETVSYVGKVLGGNGAQLLQNAVSAPQSPTAPGTIQGRPIMTPEQTSLSEAYGKQAADTMQQGVKADDSLTRIKVLDQADQYFTPGSSGEMRMQGMKVFADGLRQIGITPPASFLNGAAAGETIQKEGGYLAAEMTRSLGSREAAAVFNQVRNIQPGITLSEGGYQVIKNSIAMGLQRQKDLAQYQAYWLQPQAQGGLGKSSVAGMVDSFNEQRPLDVYASRVIPYQMPKTQDGLVPNAVYRTARGPATWNGSAFQAIQ